MGARENAQQEDTRIEGNGVIVSRLWNGICFCCLWKTTLISIANTSIILRSVKWKGSTVSVYQFLVITSGVFSKAVLVFLLLVCFFAEITKLRRLIIVVMP